MRTRSLQQCAKHADLQLENRRTIYDCVHACRKSHKLGLLVCKLHSTRVGIAKLVCAKEIVQEAVHLALPLVPVEEDADPGNYALKQKYGQGPDEGQCDSLQVWNAAPVFLWATALTQSVIKTSQLKQTESMNFFVHLHLQQGSCDLCHWNGQGTAGFYTMRKPWQRFGLNFNQGTETCLFRVTCAKEQ